MPLRPSGDRPLNEPIGRIGWIRKESIDENTRRLLVGFPGYGIQPAEDNVVMGQRPLPYPVGRIRGTRRRDQWHSEGGIWRL